MPIILAVSLNVRERMRSPRKIHQFPAHELGKQELETKWGHVECHVGQDGIAKSNCSTMKERKCSYLIASFFIHSLQKTDHTF